MSLLQRKDLLSIAEKKQIDRICLAFEDRWLDGRRPVLEHYLHKLTPAAQGDLLRELLLIEIDYRRSMKDEPRVDDYVARFPGRASVVRAAFDAALRRPAPARHLPGTSIGRYRVRKTLGVGGFGTVLLARDEQLDRDVAVKVPHQSSWNDEPVRQRFLDEARALADLKHPGIVAVHDAGQLEDGTVFLVMQFVEGKSLRRLIDAGPLPVGQAVEIAARIADAINVAHCHGVVHRDLKPSNILLDAKGSPHVCDFGLALRDCEQTGRTGEYAGTLAYMAPEQLRGESHRLDGRADIWALGVILYEMLTGRQPFRGRDKDEITDEVLHRDPRPVRQINPLVPRHLAQITCRCLAKRPADRFATSDDLAEALRRTGHAKRSRAWVASATLLLVSVLAVSAMWVWGPRSPNGAADATSAPIDGAVELHVWDRADPRRQGVPLSNPRALPLRPGDRVRLTAHLSQPAYAYVVWLDSHGSVLPVFPWQQGAWTERPPIEHPRCSLSLPDEVDAGWTMQKTPDGTEVLILLARRTPLPRDVNLASLLAPAARELASHRTEPASSRTPEDDRSGDFRDRAPILRDSRKIDDPVLALQRQLTRQLQPYFDLIRTVNFAVTD